MPQLLIQGVPGGALRGFVLVHGADFPGSGDVVEAGGRRRS